MVDKHFSRYLQKLKGGPGPGAGGGRFFAIRYLLLDNTLYISRPLIIDGDILDKSFKHLGQRPNNFETNNDLRSKHIETGIR